MKITLFGKKIDEKMKKEIEVKKKNWGTLKNIMKRYEE